MSPRRSSLSVRACAKVNLSLRVLGTRPDGYHELRTVFQTLALHDTLTLRQASGALRLTTDDPACPADPRNLVWKAADRLWTAAGRRGTPRGVAMHLAKRIPVQAGLGGGSSDAAAALVALHHFWRLDLSTEALRDVARTLGADVPYFLQGGTAVGVERGDLLYPMADLRPAFVVLVIPPFGVSTPDAFRWWDEDHRKRSAHAVVEKSATDHRRSGAGVGWNLPEVGNDLQASVARRHPEIERLVEILEGRGAAYAAMSGSGSAVFGVFATQPQALDAAAAISPSAGVAAVTKTLSGRQFRAQFRPF